MPKLNIPQAKFLSMNNKFRAYVAGFGSGKTWVGCGALMKHFAEYPKVNAGYFAPTFGQIKDIFYPTIEEVAYDWGFSVDIKSSNKEVHIYRGKYHYGTIICRSMDNPSSIVGFKIGQALCDELDVMPTAKAQIAWRKIIARMRYKIDGLRNGVDVTTTPEGFKFVYQQFVKEIREKPELKALYGIIQASTYDNEANLPDDYIESLRQSYPPQLIDAYLNGQFVNLSSGTVYVDFDRLLNHSDTVMDLYEPLHVGMDFNVMNMSAVVHVVRGDYVYAVDELKGVRDTPEMARVLSDKYPNRQVIIYPDASGQNTTSKDASESDLSILRKHGFVIRVGSQNPYVRDRVLSVNAAFCNMNGERRYFVNTNKCPSYTECLEQQAYDANGMPDKTGGFDHLNDAAGYFINHHMPIIKPISRQSSLKVR
ncbi:terminase large subunit domain-containing protein [Pasteurella multocida]|uniref:terminase large subunit domain-containing protein n=1 Tax=Pasteurella multocida TaxID=747 RepID=UPI0007EDE463|nr:terminase family protein [Pasteurella multocida]MCL7822610.1 terminase large subunit [Pasteurella multocida]OBP35906.1 terminase [Pasteurella multocida subsp. multocida]URH99338.1 terminase large subunit [Pasteurella multocida]HDR1312787.1 terminase family protein [Pasteurella multocida]